MIIWRCILTIRNQQKRKETNQRRRILETEERDNLRSREYNEIISTFEKWQIIRSDNKSILLLSFTEPLNVLVELIPYLLPGYKVNQLHSFFSLPDPTERPSVTLNWNIQIQFWKSNVLNVLVKSIFQLYTFSWEWVWTQGFVILKQALYHLTTYTSNPFCFGYFRDGGLEDYLPSLTLNHDPQQPQPLK
jgi:hypothetical protein